jgi:inorganic triphosphatase YgiF
VAGSTELELKYRVSERTAERYLADEELAGLRPLGGLRTRQVEDRYVDTSSGALANAGYAARLRESGGTTIVSLKAIANPEAGALHRRQEIEGPANRMLQPVEWPPSDARSLVLELSGDRPLVELVTIRQVRRARRFGATGTVVELTVDAVEVIARSAIVDRFLELEVELVDGDEPVLARVGEALSGDPALTPVASSKLESALAAIRERGGPSL